MYVAADMWQLCVYFGGTQRSFFYWLSLSQHVWKALSTCNTVTPLRGQVEPFFAENLHTKQNPGRPLCSVSNTFFKLSICIAEANLHEPYWLNHILISEKQMFLNQAVSVITPSIVKVTQQTRPVLQVHRQQFNFFMLKMVH